MTALIFLIVVVTRHISCHVEEEVNVMCRFPTRLPTKALSAQGSSREQRHDFLILPIGVYLLDLSQLYLIPYALGISTHQHAPRHSNAF